MKREEVIQRLRKIEDQNRGKNNYVAETVRAAGILLCQGQQFPEWMGPGPHYVVATEEDSDPEIFTWDKFGQPVLKHPWLKPSSAIVHEHEIPAATSLEHARERAAMFGKKYGRAAIFRLVLVETLP